MNDLSFEFNSPMTKEDWEKLADNEMEDTVEVTFKTPSGKRVPFRKVKHGEWKHNKNNDVIKCSECGFGIMDSTFVWEIRNCCGTIEDNPFNFCPNCGADMRGETE